MLEAYNSFNFVPCTIKSIRKSHEVPLFTINKISRSLLINLESLHDEMQIFGSISNERDGVICKAQVIHLSSSYFYEETIVVKMVAQFVQCY